MRMKEGRERWVGGGGEIIGVIKIFAPFIVFATFFFCNQIDFPIK